jgi:cysteine desulfurase/selenocysteine lyase
VGAEAEEMILVRNATEGINLVAFAWGLKNIKKGDEIVTTVIEHHANLIPWQELSKKTGASLRVVDVTDEDVFDMRDFKDKLSSKTKLVAVVHVSNVTGEILPVKEIVKLSKRVGARVLIDAAQSVQHLGFDVKKIPADFLAFSGHKMLGPMGAGGVYIKKARQEEMEVFMTGGGMIKEVSKERAKWADGVEKWEAGTPNVSGAVGLAEAVKYHERLGLKQIRRHEKELTEYTLKRLEEVKGVRLIGPREVKIRGGLVTFVMEKIHAHDVAQILDSEGVAVRSGHHCTMPLHRRLGLLSSTRASFYIYNTKEDVDRLIEGLKKVKKVFK